MRLYAGEQICNDGSCNQVVVCVSEFTPPAEMTKDLVEAFYKIAESKKTGEIYNLGSGKPTSINRIIKLIRGKKIYIKKRPGEPDVTHASISKIKKHTGWYPRTSIQKGVEIMKRNKIPLQL